MSTSDELALQKVAIAKAYDEVVNCIVLATSPESVVSFRPSAAVKARVDELIAKEKEDGLSTEETTALSLYIQLEHIMRLAKARARQLMVI